MVIPTHDRPRLLRQAVDSIVRQDYPNLEIVVVDDGSETAAHDVLDGWSDASATTVEHRPSGRTATRGGRNAGVRAGGATPRLPRRRRSRRAGYVSALVELRCSRRRCRQLRVRDARRIVRGLPRAGRHGRVGVPRRTREPRRRWSTSSGAPACSCDGEFEKVGGFHEPTASATRTGSCSSRSCWPAGGRRRARTPVPLPSPRRKHAAHEQPLRERQGRQRDVRG